MADPTFAISLFTGLIDKAWSAIQGNRASAAATEQSRAAARINIAQIEAEKEIALKTLASQEEIAFKTIELQTEVLDIEATSTLRQTLSEGLETLADQLGITQPIVLETAPKEAFNFTPVIIGGLVLIGLTALR
ncbi:hypothetical protein ES702_05953 [subsurface metagenome]